MKTSRFCTIICFVVSVGFLAFPPARAALPLRAPEFITLDGTPAGSGNALDGDNIKVLTSPVLRIYHTQSASPQGTVLLFPGGGYRWLAMKWEGEGTAAALTEKGFDVVILEYHVLDNQDVAALPESSRMAKTRELALEDALKAYRLIRREGRTGSFT